MFFFRVRSSQLHENLNKRSTTCYFRVDPSIKREIHLFSPSFVLSVALIQQKEKK